MTSVSVCSWQVLFVSALEGEGVEDLRTLLCGRQTLISCQRVKGWMTVAVSKLIQSEIDCEGTSILVGNSGVGKSHLLNRLGEAP